MLELSLPDSLATSLASGHPWVYRDHVGDFRAPTGSWVRVKSGSYQAVGLWDADSPIALRLFSSGAKVDQGWVRQRIEEAWLLRSQVREQGTTGYRLVFGEADQLPGVVIDAYDGFFVVVTYSKALGSLIPWLVDALQRICSPRGIVRRIKTERGADISLLFGELPPEEIVVAERDMLLAADLYRGQKTGLFFDHRENRQFVRHRAAGARVLNLFSYNGGFSVAAALGGAVSVTSVDVAGPAVAACQHNLVLNGLGHVPHEPVVADVFEFLERSKSVARRWDLVVCDPPSFAKNREQLKAAEKAYRRLMAAGLSVTEPGGLFCGASCTSQVSPAGFRRALADAARKARVRLQLTHDAGQPVDHPVAIGHEEGRYLKFLAGRVLERC